MIAAIRIVIGCLLLIASPLTVQSNSVELHASKGPAMTMFRTCKEALKDPWRIVDRLVEVGWREISGDRARNLVAKEREHMLLRAELSKRSHPDGWSDVHIPFQFKKLGSSTLDQLPDAIEKRLKNRIGGDVEIRIWGAVPPSGRGTASVQYYPGSNSLNCEIVLPATDDEGLRDAFLADRSWERERGATRGGLGWLGYRNASVTLLSEHARRPDDRFPVKFDLSLWANFRTK